MNDLIKVRLDTGKYLVVTHDEFISLDVSGRVLSYDVIYIDDITIDSRL